MNRSVHGRAPTLSTFPTPSVRYIVGALERLQLLNEAVWRDPYIGEVSERLAREIHEGIVKHGIVEVEVLTCAYMDGPCELFMVKIRWAGSGGSGGPGGDHNCRCSIRLFLDRLLTLYHPIRLSLSILDVQPGVRMYAYEVDGLGNFLADFDDPNLPSLLAIPLLNYDKYDRQVYLGVFCIQVWDVWPADRIQHY